MADYRPPTFGEAFNKARREGRKEFTWRGGLYSTKTAEEQSREIGAEARKHGSGRGQSVGRRADDRDVTVGRADAGQYRGSIPTPIGAPTNRPEPSSPSMMERMGSGLSDTAKKILAATGATAAAGGGAYALYRAKKARDAAEAAKRAADDERLASRLEPLMRRSGEGVDEAMKQARVEMAREPQLERARAFSAAEKKAPAVQGDKAKMSPRSRTRENEEGEFKRGGKVKTYAKGGSVKGAGCEQRGLRKCKVC